MGKKRTGWEFCPLGSILVQVRFNVPVHQLELHLSVRARRTAEVGQFGKHFQLSRECGGDDGPAETGVCAPAVVDVIGVGTIQVDSARVGEFLSISPRGNKVDIYGVALFDRNRLLVVDRCRIGGDDTYKSKAGRCEAEPEENR